MIHPTILSLIGVTPVVYLNRVFPHPRIRLATKLEAQNVGGSIKDRVALAMIEAAEASGELTPDASAASIMARATRSLMDPPTFWASSLVASRMRGCKDRKSVV